MLLTDEPADVQELASPVGAMPVVNVSVGRLQARGPSVLAPGAVMARHQPQAFGCFRALP